MVALYDQLFLFGDSITEYSFDQQRGFGWAAALQNAYIRRLDVVNRGFSGYNTRQALKVLPRIIPSPGEARIRFLVIFFGANDAALPQEQNNQHIPLSEYKENLGKIIHHPLVTAHDPRIILVAPAPINEHLQWLTDKEKGLKSVSRIAAVTKTYADAVCEVGARYGVPVINLWKAFMSKAGFEAENWKEGDVLPGSMDAPKNHALVNFMHDGLHFDREGYEILFQETMRVIAAKWPEQMPERLPMVLPGWSDTAAWGAFETKPTKKYVDIRLVDTKKDTFFKISDTAPLRRLMNAYLEVERLDTAAVRFEFDGNPVQPEDTAKSLGIEDGDSVDVVLINPTA